MTKPDFNGSKLFGSLEWKTEDDAIYCSEGVFSILNQQVTGDHTITKQQLFELVAPGNPRFLEEAVTRAKSEKEVVFSFELIKPDQPKKVIQAWLYYTKSDTGNSDVVTGSFLDITSGAEREQHQNKPYHTHMYTETLANMASWQWNPAQNVLSVSPNFFRLLHLDPQGFEKTYHNFLSLVHIDDRHKLPPVTNVQVTDENAAPVEIRMLIEGKDPLHVKSMHRLSLNESGEMVVFGTLQDITDEVALRRELEEKRLFAEMLFDRSIDLISAYDQDFNIIAWNKKCEERYGVLKEHALGKNVLDLFPGITNDPWLSDLTNALKGEFIFRTDQTSNSLEGHFDNYLLPLITDDGEILGALSISHDLTEMRNVAKRLDELNHSLEEKNEELERSNKELASFSYVASHDLQEPLRKIQTFSQRIIDTESAALSVQGKDYLRRMESAAKRMQSLIEDLLTFSRTNTSLKNMEAVDLNKMVHEITTSLKDVIEEKSAVIEIVNLPVANVVRFQFRQLLENLLSNALKYSKTTETPRISISSELFTGVQIKMHGVNINKNYFKITIADNGIGFEQQYAEKIFELFQRLHGKHEYPGTGLGLSICKKVIQNHHGFISASGEPGKGAVFTIYLPE